MTLDPQLLAILAVTAIVLMVGDKFILQPLSTSWNARNKRIADLEKQVAEGTAKLERDRAIRDRWNAMRANSLTNDVSAAETRALGALTAGRARPASPSAASSPLGSARPSARSTRPSSIMRMSRAASPTSRSFFTRLRRTRSP